MKRVLTVRAMDKFLKSLPKKSYSWHDFQANKKHCQSGFCIVVRDDKYHGSIHVSAHGQIHGFNQSRKKPEVAYWSKRYQFSSVAELQKLYQDLYKRLYRTTRTKF